MVQARTRAFQWREQLDEGLYATIDDLAKSEGIGKTYVSQVLRLTLLATDVVEAILNGRQPARLQSKNLLEGLRSNREGQRLLFG